MFKTKMHLTGQISSQISLGVPKMQFSLSVPSFEKSESVSTNMWHEKCIGQQLQALLGAFITVGHHIHTMHVF
jgi:hypothetical protein